MGDDGRVLTALPGLGFAGLVIAEGLQKIRPGMVVDPAEAPAASAAG